MRNGYKQLILVKKLIIVLAILVTTRLGIANAVTITDIAGTTPMLSSKLGTQYTEQQIRDLIAVYASKYGANAGQMLETVRCESVGFKNVQSKHILNGVREDSWGIAQINLYWNPEVTKEQALDPYFSMDFMAKKFSKGNADRWTCYRSIYQS